MSTTTQKKRLAALAAVAFGGSILLGACDGAPNPCAVLFDAHSDLSEQIGILEDQQAELETDSVEYDLLEVKITALEEVLEAKEAALEAGNCYV